MQQFTDKSHRNFDQMAVPGLSNEARNAVNAAFDAMSTWRMETVNNNEKNLEQVIEKMAGAARALGWPEQVVDATRSQMQSLTKTQIHVMDQMMDAWVEQVKSPNPSAMLYKLKSLPGFGAAGSWPAELSAMNPMQLFMQFAEQWQKAWSDAMAFWTKAASQQTAGWPRH
jgi:glycerate kinase